MKRWILTAALLITLIGSVCGTYAYTTVSSQSHNVITSGGVEIIVEEWQETDHEGRIPFPKEAVNVMPGQQVSKIVTIRNLDRECFVRACLEVTVTDTEGNTSVLQLTDVEKLLQWEVDKNFWQQKKDDGKWWYYSCPLAVGDVTEPLFQKVRFSGREMDNTWQGNTVQIHVKAQAVQSQNNGESALLAAGWPVS